MTIKDRFPPVAVGAFLLSLLFHALTLFELQQALGNAELFPYSTAILTSIVGASVLLSVFMLVARSLPVFRVLLGLRFALLLVFGFSVEGRLPLQLAFLVPVLLETAVYEAWPWNLLLGLTTVLASAALQGLETLRQTAGGVDLLNYLVFGSVLAVIASLGSLFRERLLRDRDQLSSLRRSIEEITRASMGYMDMASSAGERSTLAERNRITRELHDTIGYTFTNLIMMMEAATDLAERDPREMKETVQAARSQAEQGLSEVRRALYLLREREDSRETGLAAIASMARLFERATRIAVRIEFGNAPNSCGEDIDSALYHFVQEGLTNSFRHGNASHVDVIFWRDDGTVTVTLRDNGRGAAVIREGIGIRGMRERFGKLGGTIEGSGFPGGFRIAAQVPLDSPVSLEDLRTTGQGYNGKMRRPGCGVRMTQEDAWKTG